MPSVFTESGPLLVRELEADAKRIDRGLVRLSCRFRPDWTGVRWNVNLRLTYTVEGQLFAYESPMGTIGLLSTVKEWADVQKQVDELVERITATAGEHRLDVRGATHE